MRSWTQAEQICKDPKTDGSLQIVGGVRNCDVCESKAAIEEYTSYIVEKRRQHSTADQAASDSADVLSISLQDFSSQARRHVFRTIKLCCLVVAIPRNIPPAVAIDLSGSALNAGAFDLCLRLVQTFLLSAG